MAISRMQQPRQMYGLGSFVKKAVRKVTRPFTKVAKKIVPKEVAGIMRVAAPFLPPQLRAAAYLLGTAKQTGRISPIDLALVAAPRIGQMKLGGDQTIAQRLGALDVPFTDRNLKEVLVGAPEFKGINESIQASPMGRTTVLEGVGAKDATSGIFGKGGEMFQFGKDGVGILDTKAGQTLFGKETDEGFKFSPAKLAGVGISTLSLIQNSKTPDEAGEALVAATGDSDDYERGKLLFSQLTPELFAVPERFRMDAKGGGIMRTNYARGSDDDDKPELTSLMKGMRSPNARLPEEITNLFAGMRSQRGVDFFKDLFLDRQGGGGKDYMLPMEASERKDLNEIFVIGGDDIRKAKEIEAERILPSLYNQAMMVIDAIQDIDDEETRQKMMDDVNSSFDRTEGFGLAKAANSYYNIIQKYGYLLDKPGGLGSMMPKRAEQADGGIMRTNYAIGSEDPKPVNPFGPKPTGPVLPEEDKPFRPKPLKPIKIAGSDRYQRILEQLINELEDQLGRELTDAEYDMVGKMAYDKLSDPDFAVGGRVDYALGTRPTAEESGLGGLPIEADMRYTGGFMPYGAKEKADDVPARLSKNEFVFTADAVRAAGGGSVNEGAKKMYATMKQLEAKPEAKGMTA